MTWKWPICTDC